MKAGRVATKWLADDMPESLSVEALEAWVAKSPTDAELDSWAQGEVWVAQMEARGIEVPPIAAHVANAYGLTEVAKLVHGAIAELAQAGALSDPFSPRIGKRLARQCLVTGHVPAEDVKRISDAVAELERASLVHRVRGGLVIRRAS